jgi:hypothetical protein
MEIAEKFRRNVTNNSPKAPMEATSKDIRRMLGLSLHGWENSMVVFLIIAGFFALLAGVATSAVVRLQRVEIAESKEEFDEYKLTVEGKVAEARKEGIEAGKTAGSALLRASETEKQNLAMRVAFANRRITEEQHKMLVEMLSKQTGTINIDVMNDSESGLYAADLLKTFNDAGWITGTKQFLLGEVWTGLILEATSNQADVLVAMALKSASIPFSVAKRDRPSVTVLVGGKPPVF